MEREQSTSIFQKILPVLLTPTSGVYKKSKIGYKASLEDSLSEFSQKVASKNYQLLDSLTGQASYFLLNFLDDYQFPKLRKILNLLKSKKIVQRVLFSDTRYNDAPSFYRIKIIANEEKKIGDERILKEIKGSSLSKNAEEAFSKAIGEILERLFSSVYYKKDLIYDSPKNLQNKKIPALDLNLLAGFSEEQKKNNVRRQFDESSFFYWGKTQRVLSGKTAYLPAQLLYWRYSLDKQEPFLAEGNTNGAGGFFTQEGAILSGLYELIQRDAFFIYWLNSLTPEQIDPKTIPHDGFQEILEESARYGFEVYCLNITTDLEVPTFAVVISDLSGKSPRFSLGAGCQADPIKALYQALKEAWCVYYLLRAKTPLPALDENYKPFHRKISQEDRLRLWSNSKMAKYFNFLIKGEKIRFEKLKFNYPREFNSPKEELGFLARRVEKLGSGYEVYYQEVKHPILAEIGYHVVQVVVPQLVPLYLFEKNMPLGSRRIKEVPAKLGFKVAEEINPWPHPFP